MVPTLFYFTMSNEMASVMLLSHNFFLFQTRKFKIQIIMLNISSLSSLTMLVLFFHDLKNLYYISKHT